MNRTLLLVALFLVLGGAVWYALSNKKKQAGSHVSWDMDFAVTSTDNIGKIFIADRKGGTTTLEQKGKQWIYNGKYPARPSAIETLLETISKVNVLNIPPNGAVPGMVKEMAAMGIKVEIYDREGKSLKTYYIGGVTNDERGTVLMMDGSEQPYVAHIPGFIGQFRMRFIMGDDNWRDKAIFREKPEEIQAVSVEYPQRKNESFKLEKTGEAAYDIKPYYGTTTPMTSPRRKGVAEAYLVQFESLVAEAFETANPLRDSVKALVPFAILTMKKTDGAEKKVRFWPVEVEMTREGASYVSRYFTDVNDEDFMLTQDRVFGSLFRGYGFFYEGMPEKKRLRN
ncbi:MAG: DUF4340 domain-containing protein [Saprospiraceae bacterium]|nr:DUF4340 domain-containing protein [Saprospiraceae bacterium]